VLFGVFAIHAPESCPLNNRNSKKIFLDIRKKLKENTKKFHVNKIIGFYMSVLEHEWIIIIDAKSAHDIENLCIEVGISAISTIKIVPINDFNIVSKRLSK
jgi:hypothetical protein